MIPLESKVRGTIQPDGTLLLDEPPTLPPGPVDVTVRQAFVAPPHDPNQSRPGWMETLDRIHRDQAARGYVPRTKAEVDAELHEIRYGCTCLDNAGAGASADKGDPGGGAGPP